ncbi:elongation factor 1-delta isoform X1 [Patella vulgata]|uniref:elongation factor 1-delta isoform X1 n=2 Tax=Patella vulgata TaxID=6465 RepID=UPI00217F9E48|nr:elongation factor 1-delta isoform X1 [Patella vulgata]
MTGHPLTQDSVWMQQRKYEDAESFYQSVLAGTAGSSPNLQGSTGSSSLVNEIAQARQQIQNVLKNTGGSTMDTGRIEALERENKELRKATDDLRKLTIQLEKRICVLEGGSGSAPGKSAPSKQAAAQADDDDDDDDFELFDDDEDEDKAAEELKAQRIAAYKAKKSDKPVLIAKSNVVLDVKPWDDETDMKIVEEKVRTIEMPGLRWGAAKLAPVGYGIMKLQIMCVVEDDKVSIEELTDKIQEFEDFVQSVDIAAFNKI